ncbi:MAG: hypothetical protein ACK5SB_02240 [Flavobacterium sp.]
MAINTLLWLVLALIVAGGLSYFHYIYKAKTVNLTVKVLSFLRFLAIFGLLLLLINPIIRRSTLQIQKPPLAVVVDNSSSIKELGAQETSKEIWKKITSNTQLRDKFDIQSFYVDSESRTFFDDSSLTYQGKASRLDLVGPTVHNLYKNLPYTTIVLTDGNQTSGSDYVFGFQADHKVFPVIMGDTTQYLDLRIAKVNANKYAFYKNQFPVEIFVNYNGTKPLQATFSIRNGASVVYRQALSFSPNKRAQVVNALLPANVLGVQTYSVNISSNEKEKNTYNNTQRFAVDVIDQRTEVALISEIEHPDLGVLKRSIESNAQRKVTLLKPQNASDLQKYNILLLYQPTARFKSVWEANKTRRLNTFIITGNHTDFGFLNQMQKAATFKMSNQKEDYQASYRSDFSLFASEDIGFEQFPPLENPFGNVSISSSVQPLLESRIRTIGTGDPLWFFTENEGQRSAMLLGENIWKWRAHVFVAKQSFEPFDQFLDKTMQYLASNDARKSLVVNHERFYNSGDPLEITAQFFNKNYEFDAKARLSITLVNKQNQQKKQYDLLLSNQYYKVDLEGLTPGKYAFTVRELNTNTLYSGAFEVLDFNIEKQFVNPNVDQLKQLAQHTQGRVYVPSQINQLIEKLIADPNYQPIQKEQVVKSPLIEWTWLLLLITVLLAAEWFIRKYNGML